MIIISIVHHRSFRITLALIQKEAVVIITWAITGTANELLDLFKPCIIRRIFGDPCLITALFLLTPPTNTSKHKFLTIIIDPRTETSLKTHVMMITRAISAHWEVIVVSLLPKTADLVVVVVAAATPIRGAATASFILPHGAQEALLLLKIRAWRIIGDGLFQACEGGEVVAVGEGGLWRWWQGWWWWWGWRRREERMSMSMRVSMWCEASDDGVLLRSLLERWVVRKRG